MSPVSHPSCTQATNYEHKLKSEFELSEDHLRLAFILPHTIAFEPYVIAFDTMSKLDTYTYSKKARNFLFHCSH